ncbi:MAG: hypothetical protein QF467_07520 [SAR202 cluster bacterium]|nr:hypothetical protein [SAR202 cluster bacterium]
MTVRACRDILILLAYKGSPMDTVEVLLVDVLVAGSAGLGSPATRVVRRWNPVSTMAVGAHRGIAIPLTPRLVVDTVNSFSVIVEMASSADLVPVK